MPLPKQKRRSGGGGGAKKASTGPTGAAAGSAAAAPRRKSSSTAERGVKTAAPTNGKGGSRGQGGKQAKRQQGSQGKSAAAPAERASTARSFSSSSSSTSSEKASGELRGAHGKGEQPYIAFAEDVSEERGDDAGANQRHPLESDAALIAKASGPSSSAFPTASQPSPGEEGRHSDTGSAACAGVPLNDSCRGHNTGSGDSSSNGLPSGGSGASARGLGVHPQQGDAARPLSGPSTTSLTLSGAPSSHARHAGGGTAWNSPDEPPIHVILDNMAKKAKEIVRRSKPHSASRRGLPHSRGVVSKHAPVKTLEELHAEFMAIQLGCGYGLCEEEEIPLRAAECGVPLHGPWMAAAGFSLSKSALSTLSQPVSDGSAGSGGGGGSHTSALGPPSALNARGVGNAQLPPAKRGLSTLSAATLLRVMEFCDVPSLGQLACVCLRLHALSQHQHMWMAHAARLGVDVTTLVSRHSSSSGWSSSSTPTPWGNGVSVADIQSAIRAVLNCRRQSEEAEITHFARELRELEQRMAARTEANYRQAIDVNRTLATHNPSAILSGGFVQKAKNQLLQQSIELADDGSDGFDGCARAPPAEKCRAMLQRLRALEATRTDILASIEGNAQTLAEQQASLTDLCQRAARVLGLKSDSGDGGDSGGDAGEAGKDSGDQHRPKEAPSADEVDDVIGRTYISFGELCAFEKRVSRLILNGGYNSNTSIEEALAREVPLVLRRGVIDFATLELLLMQWAPSSSACGADTNPTSNVTRVILARWAAFQAFFPLTEDYYLVRQFLQDRELLANSRNEDDHSRGSSAAAAASSSSSGGGGDNRRDEGSKAPPKRIETALIRVSSVVRKIGAMKDNEVLNVVM